MFILNADSILGASNQLRVHGFSRENVHATAIFRVDSFEMRALCFLCALRHFNFDKYTFPAVIIERPTPELNALLFYDGYTFVRNVRFYAFYVHESVERLGDIKKNRLK